MSRSGVSIPSKGSAKPAANLTHIGSTAGGDDDR